MINVVVLDDNKNDLNNIKQYIHKFAIENNIDFKAKFFSCFEEFNYFINETHEMGLILIFDIQLGNKNGIAEATKLKDKYQEKIQSLIFISNYPDFVFTSFQAKPDAYLCKTSDYPTFKNTLERIMNDILSTSFSHHNLLIKNIENDETELVPESQVICIQVSNSYERSLIIYTEETRIITHTRLNILENQLDSKNFFQVSRSAIINLNWIHAVAKKAVKMNGSDELLIPISRFKRKNLLEKLDAITLNEMNEK